MKHTDATATLRSINATLRRAEDLHWTDPEFLAWERGQVGELHEEPTVIGAVVVLDYTEKKEKKLVRFWAYPGPRHERFDPELRTEDAIFNSLGNHARPSSTPVTAPTQRSN